MRLCFVAFQPIFHSIVNQLLIFAVLHIDEVADDQTADVAEP